MAKWNPALMKLKSSWMITNGAFGKKMFHGDPLATEPEMQGTQVHPLHAIFPGMIAIASNELLEELENLTAY